MEDVRVSKSASKGMPWGAGEWWALKGEGAQLHQTLAL
jgi:hypothetical protein